MKKTIVLGLLVCSVMFFANCHPKAIPADSGKKQPTAVVKDTITHFPNEQIITGKTIFETNCNKCHDLPKPGEYNMQAWNDILPKMIDKANLAEDKGKMVTAYVAANAKA